MKNQRNKNQLTINNNKKKIIETDDDLKVTVERCVERQFTHVFHSNAPDRKGREGLCCSLVDNHR